VISARFVPPHPPRGSGPVAAWRGFFGERARTAVYGWSQLAFETHSMQRRILGFNVYIPLDPVEVQRVLLDNAANYAKPDIVKGLLGPTIGRGLLTADGPLWRTQRKIVAASFAPAAVDALIPLFARSADAEAGAWREGRQDMAETCTATTMRVIAEALFGGDRRLVTRQALAHIAAALEGVGEARIQALLRLPLVPVSPKGLAAHRGQKFLRETLTTLVRERLADGPGADFLGRMIAALHEGFPPDEALALSVDNAATFYLAGHETTANALTWTLFLLSEQPELQEEAAAEAQAALEAGTDEADWLDRLPLLRRIVDESLRLYPPVVRLDRQAVAADRHGDYQVSPGDIISVWPWLLHRHGKLWDDPDSFDARRFEPAKSAERHRFQYIPFGGGPRTCVGARFAMTEALTILACWLGQWRFSPSKGRQVQVSGMVTLRPKGGMPLVLTRR
jgi:cytochrome P450